jgi:hypothetical protein
MMLLRRALLFSLLILAISACSKSASPPLPTLTPGPAGTGTPGISTTPLVLPPLPAATATAAGSPTPFVSFNVSPNVEGLKLRIGPGYLFDALRLLEGDAVLTVMGKSPGGEWIKVTAADGTQGWVFAKLVKSSVNLQAIPVIEPQGILVIKGRVTDIVGTPIRGVGFEVKQGDGAETNVATSDASGEFYAFMPIDASGEWTVTQNAIACEESNVYTDSNCTTLKAGYTGMVEPQSQKVTLPQSGELAFTFK